MNTALYADPVEELNVRGLADEVLMRAQADAANAAAIAGEIAARQGMLVGESSTLDGSPTWRSACSWQDGSGYLCEWSLAEWCTDPGGVSL